MSSAKWYERYSWVVFVFVALTGIVPAVQLMIAPLSGQSFFAGFGHPIPDSILSNPEERAFMVFMLRWIGTVLIAGNLFTLIIATTAWRTGAKWAWAAMWYWPLLFASHFLMYEGVLRSVQVVGVALTALTLLSNYNRFFSVERSART